MDWGRRPYTTTARLFDTAGSPTVKLRWYVTDQPFQDFPSAINTLDMDEEPWRERKIGEVFGEPRTHNGLWSMPGLPGDHQCGTPGQFMDGVPYDPAREPAVLDRDWIPRCCNRGPVGVGAVGVAGGGVLGLVLPLEGGAMLGVLAAGVLAHGPGSDCESAPFTDAGDTHGATIAGVGTVQTWKVSGLTPGNTYHIATSHVGHAGEPGITAEYGNDCGAMAPLALAGALGGDCYSFVMGAGDFALLTFTGTAVGSVAYSFQVLAGGCP